MNLGSGPKLLGTEFTVTDPKHRLFDRMDVHAYSWGDDPYGTFHLRAKKKKLYEFNADYRDMAYFNFLPSFADPLLARGITLNQQSFDTRRRLGDFQLDLLPGNWITPYLAYERDSSSGSGIATFVSDGNQYPAPTCFTTLPIFTAPACASNCGGCMHQSNREASRLRTIRLCIKTAA